MKKMLKRVEFRIWHYVNGEKKEGKPAGLSGDVTGLSGDVSGLRGYVTGLSGDVSGLSGDVTGLRGNLDDCKITDAERAAGVKVEDLVAD